MIEFEEAFFRAETREGFYIEKDMKHVWAAQMEVLMEIDRVCKMHDIQWFADYGTLLGAIRHKGYIPWDDDIDICMKRQDYERFLQVAPNELGQEYRFRSIYSDVHWEEPFMRISNARNYTPWGKAERFHGCPYIVGIDIFPLDYLPEDFGEREVLLILCQCVHNIKLLSKAKETEKVEKILLQLEEYLQVKFERTGSFVNQSLRMIDKLSSLYNEGECRELAELVCLAINQERARDKEWYRESVLVPFENIMIPVPIEAEKVLEALYGDWRKPIKNAASHEYSSYKNQKKHIEAMYSEKDSKLDESDEKIKVLEDMDWMTEGDA